MIKTIIFKGIIWNSLFIMFLCENSYHARFIRLKCLLLILRPPFGLLKLVALAFVVIHLGFPYRCQVWINIHLV